jgi:hypothetical protein
MGAKPPPTSFVGSEVVGVCQRTAATGSSWKIRSFGLMRADRVLQAWESSQETERDAHCRKVHLLKGPSAGSTCAAYPRPKRPEHPDTVATQSLANVLEFLK